LMPGFEVSMNGSVVNMRAEELRPLNSISLRTQCYALNAMSSATACMITVWFAEGASYSTSRVW
jgi:hypothetical protein